MTIKTKVFEIDEVNARRDEYIKNETSDDLLRSQIEFFEKSIENAQLGIAACRSLLTERESKRIADAREIQRLQDAAYVMENREEKALAETVVYQAFLTKFDGDTQKARKAARKFSETKLDLDNL